MVRRHNNQLPVNLPQLQNLIKRDCISYKDEFIQQQRHFKSLLQVFQLHPESYNKKLDELVMFMAQVAHCYPDLLKNYAQELMDLLHSHNTVLEPEMRLSFCKALILLRNKNLLAPTDLLSLFFQLLKSRDKNLRTFLKNHIINDIKNMNIKFKQAKLNTTLQNFMFDMLNDTNSKAVKMSLDIMIELYKKNIWNNEKTVNVIATACFSKTTKVMVAALKFFLTSEEKAEKGSDDDSSDDETTVKDVIMANKVNKKTRKRDKQLKKVKSLVKKEKKKKGQAPAYNFSALHLLHDPQGLSEKLLHQLESRHERFEVKIMSLDVISRLIGVHQLMVLNFYPYVQRFLQPHQKEVTKLLQFVAQASHELVPPEVLEPVLKTVVNNFVSERNTSDVMAVGLNAVREICARCPLVMNQDLLRDLVEYKNYKIKSVMMAARSLIHLYRTSLPEMLRKKDRGRPTCASIEIKAKKYGELDAKDYVVGAEVLDSSKTSEACSQSGDSDDSESEGSWVDVDSGDDDVEIPEGPSQQVGKGSKMSIEETLTERKEKAAEVSVARLLTDEDFQLIDANIISKQVSGLKRGTKRPLEEETNRSELVSLADIENIHKKRKNTKEERIESIRKGQEGREKFGYKDGRVNPFSSKTNREKRKNKNFMMLRHKARSKVKRSFKDKQIALRNHLLKLKKMK